MPNYYAPKVDSISLKLKGNPLGSENILQGQPFKADDLDDHLQQELKHADSRFSQLVKPVADHKAEKYLECVKNGLTHEEATLEADSHVPEETTAPVPLDPPMGPTKAEVDAAAAKGGPEPIAGSSTAHAVPGDVNPTPAITNDADAERRTATENPPAPVKDAEKATTPAPASTPPAPATGDAK